MTAAAAAASLLGILVGLVARLWLATLRLRVVVDPSLELTGALARPWVLAFFHGTQWPLLAWRRRRRTVVLVSLSRDGSMQARALALQGLLVVRGSSSRGGARGLAALVRVMRSAPCDAAFAVDGPKGPYGVVKPGALAASRATDALVVPMGSAMAHGLVLRGAWDRFAIAWPFTRVVVTLGAPMDPNAPNALAGEGAREALERAITRENVRAAELLPRKACASGTAREGLPQ